MNKLRILVAVLMAVCAPLAQAAIVISYSVDAGAAVVCSDPGGTAVTCPSVVGPPLTITTLGASSNTPGGNPSFVTSAVVALMNTTAATHTLDIFVTAQGFTTPVTPPAITVFSHIGGTVFVGAAGDTLSFQSCVKLGAVLPACPGTFNSVVGTPSITGAGSFMDDQTGSIPSGLTAPFEIGEVIHLVLGAGGSINFAASTTLTSVPEPMSISLLGGVLLLTARLIRRKASRA